MSDSIRIEVAVKRGDRSTKVASLQPLHLSGDRRRHRKELATYINALADSVSAALVLSEET